MFGGSGNPIDSTSKVSGPVPDPNSILKQVKTTEKIPKDLDLLKMSEKMFGWDDAKKRAMAMKGNKNELVNDFNKFMKNAKEKFADSSKA